MQGKSVCRSYCGDGIKAANEECDDGNVVGGDGCSAMCKIEHGYTCTLNYEDEKCINGTCTSICFATCGDGIVAQEEECDDGNSFQGDGCYNCELESEDWRCRGEPSECILRECDLPYPEVRKYDVTCPGSSTGMIDIFVNSTEDIITKVWKSDADEPASYKGVLHYSNLGSGTYWIKVSISGFEECVRETKVTLGEPSAFSKLEAYKDRQYFIVSSCDTSDGKITWTPSGGTAPYKYLFASRTPQDTGTWEKVSIKEFIMGKPSILDANNCTAEMVVKGWWPNESVCAEESVPYLIEGSILLGSAFVLVIIAAIAYSCWSSKRVVPKQAKQKARR